MPPTAIIIEDNPNSARLASKLLRGANFEVFIAEDGETGLDTANEQTADIILVDLGLPDLDGQTVVALLHQEAHMANVPVIAFTAYPTDTAMEMARAYGCDGVITKPIDTRTFVNQVRSFMKQTDTDEQQVKPGEPENQTEG
ncbi:MAG: response regulator [Chloroflexota bacterium]